jgi:hypothetical protein
MHKRRVPRRQPGRRRCSHTRWRKRARALRSQAKAQVRELASVGEVAVEGGRPHPGAPELSAIETAVGNPGPPPRPRSAGRRRCRARRRPSPSRSTRRLHRSPHARRAAGEPFPGAGPTCPSRRGLPWSPAPRRRPAHALLEEARGTEPPEQHDDDPDHHRAADELTGGELPAGDERHDDPEIDHQVRRGDLEPHRSGAVRAFATEGAVVLRG